MRLLCPKGKLIKKRITLEDLALMVSQGFEETASKVELENLKNEVMAIKSEMVTKSYLDDKLAD